MTQPIHIFVCGINNIPGSIRGWTKRGVVWSNEHDLHADEFGYFTTSVTRWARQHKRIRDLSEMIQKYSDRPIVIVAHSNGCEVTCHALQIAGVKNVTLHFLSPACPADFNENGLNNLIKNGVVSDLTVYVAGKDIAMWFAQLSRVLVGWLGLGFGTLGKSGPKNVAPFVGQHVLVRTEPTYGHSTWFDKNNFEQTMRMVTA